MKNRVLKLVEIGKVELFEEKMKPLKKGEILVGIKSVGICGSDMHYFLEGGLGTFKQPLPMYMGHEPSGVIIDSNGSDKFKNGDRVAIEPSRPCLECSWCMKGRHNLCLKSFFMGATSQGAFADFAVATQEQLIALPDDMSFDFGALLEPLGVALHAMNLTHPKAIHSVAIFGAGPIGLSLLSALRKYGVEEIYLVDKLSYRVAFAKKMGATQAFLFDGSAKKIKELTQGQGVSLAYDAAGTDDSIGGCVDVVGTGGTIGLVGIPTEDFISYNPHKLRTKEVTLQNIRRSNQTLDECLSLYKGDDKIGKMVTHHFNLEDAQKAFDLVAGYKEKVLKCMVVNE